MEGDGIGLVLARALELRSNITNCIHKASTLHSDQSKRRQEEENGGDNLSPPSPLAELSEEEETERLLDIRDAFESLEAQLSSLQALQQQQRYEKEAALSEIDYSRKKLLKKLKEYKGENMEVIYEATSFVSEAVEDSNNLLLPPYPNRRPPPRSTSKSVENGIIDGGAIVEVKNYSKGFWFFINSAAKAVISTVGVISLLGLAGFEIKFRRNDALFNVFNLFQRQQQVQCPPGKVLVVESGKIRCVVKERVEIPFETVSATTPDVKYGCG